MTTFTQRRARNFTATILAAAFIALVAYKQNLSLARYAFTTGWLLLIAMIFLTLYNARKKLPFLPLSNSSAWLQLHIYAGLLTVAVFPLHIAFRIPDGPLEITLALLFVLVAGSGILGAALSRTIPKRLSVRGEEVIFERIPAFGAELSRRARQLAVESVAASNTTTLADYYADRLAYFFRRPRNFWRHLAQSSRPRHALLAELGGLDRYLSPQEQPIARQLAELVETKDDLDYHHAMQKTLKGWLFIHLGFTYSLLMLAIVHAVMAHAFAGGVR